MLREGWNYTDEGTLDRTHLRFFTRKTMEDLFVQAGFVVHATIGINSFLEGRWRFLKPVQRIFGNTRYVQFIVVASRS